jgi:ankyrin repeat protein
MFILRENSMFEKTLSANLPFFRYTNRLISLCVEKDEKKALKKAESIVKTTTVNIDLKNQYGNTPLIAAINANRFKMVQLFLQHGADPNLPNRVGQTPLMLAVKSSNEAIVSLLILYSAKCDIEALALTSDEKIKQLIFQGQRIQKNNSYLKSPK